MSALPFDLVRRLVRERAGVVLDDSKDYLIVSRLEPLAKRYGCSLGELVARLGGSPNHLHSQVVEAMLTPETSFFRDLHPFEALRSAILPALLEARRSERSLAIWSAACASGQETYSIAMLLREHFPQLNGWKLRVIGSDFSSEMVERARGGRYTQLEINRGLPAAYLVRYFERDGLIWQVNAALRAMVELRQVNLINPLPPDLPRMDVIFLRNILIYLDEQTRRAVLQRVLRLLRPDGFLFLGATETSLDMDGELVAFYSNGSMCYRPRGCEGDERWNLSTRRSKTPFATFGP